MHENRETSETPAAKPGSRTVGEGNSRTACMYVPEESHDGTVPMNHSNKDRRPLAESEEERGAVDNAADLARCKSLRRQLPVSDG
jgi:hypothetical protein